MPFGGCAALDGQPRRLVEHDHRLVTAEDRGLQHGLVGRPHPLRRPAKRHCSVAQRRNADRLTRLYAVAGPRLSAIDAYLAGAQQLFELAMTESRIATLEPAVEANRSIAAFHCHGFVRSRHFADSSARRRSLS